VSRIPFDSEFEQYLRGSSRISIFSARVSSQGILNAVSGCTGLKQLKLHWDRSGYSGPLTVQVGFPFPRLEVLDIQHYSLYPSDPNSGECWKQAIEFMKLRSLCLGDPSLVSFLKIQLPELKQLSVFQKVRRSGSWDSWESMNVRGALNQCQSLETLCLHDSTHILNKAMLRHLGRSLKSLSITERQISATELICDLAETCPQLCSLRLGVAFQDTWVSLVSLMNDIIC
jgi:hypothetical protein